MKKVLLSIASVMLAFFSYGQTQMSLPVTFDDPNVQYGLVGFGGAEASTIEADPTDANNTVAKVIKNASAQTWAGTTITAGAGVGFAEAIPFASNMTTMTVRVWSPDAGIPILLKVENNANGGIFCETLSNTTVAGEWETITFDFANPAPNPAGLNFSNTYNMASIFFNFGTDGATAGEKTYYFDDVMAGEPTTGGLSQMNLPVTFEDETVEYGLVGFGGAEAATIEVDPTDANNTVAKVIKSAAAQTWAGTTVTNPAQQGFATAIPFDENNTTMTVRVWSPDAGIQVRLKVEDSSNPTISVETEATTTLAGEWETLTFDFSNEAPGTAAINFASNYNKASIFFNFGVDGATAGEKTYYFDDIQMGEGGGGGDVFNITFRVDMSNVTDAFTTPEVNGNFNGWCGGCAPMADEDADGIWELTIPLAAGTYEFKYAADTWNIQETLIPGTPCTVTNSGFTNRALEVSADAILDVVCWGACAACSEVEGPYNVTFKVDMSQVTDAFTTPEVNGTFNGWCGGCAPMTDDDTDGVWEITIPLNAGTYEFKYAADAWAIQESLTPGSSCTVTVENFTNRVITVDGEMEMDVVCWGSCEACVPTNVNEAAASVFSVYPNPANDLLIVNNTISTSPVHVRMFDVSGKMVFEAQNFVAANGVINTSTFENGIYTMQIVVLGNVYNTKVAIRH